MYWDDTPTKQAKKIPGGQQDQGHEVVNHDHGEGYQPHTTQRSESGSVPQGVEEGLKFRFLVRLEIHRSNTIPWA